MNKYTIIDQLTKDAIPVKPYRSNFPLWLGVLLLNALLFICVMGLRNNFMDIIKNIHFWTSNIFLFSSILFAGWATFVTSRPNLFARTYIYNIVPVGLLLIALIIKLFGEYQMNDSAAFHIDNGIACVFLTIVYSIIPFGIIRWSIRKGYSTVPQITGILAAFASTTAGSLVLNFTCFKSAAMHHIIWHYLPILGIGLLGYYIGVKLFSPKSEVRK